MSLRSTLEHYTQSKHALGAIFVASLLEMTLVPIPLEIVLVPVMLASPKRRWLAATSAWLGCIAGALLWYGLGWFAFDAVRPYIVESVGASEQVARYERDLRSAGFSIVFLAGVTPVPFQVACAVAGSVRYALPLFLAAAGAARAIRYYGLAAAVTVLGERVRHDLLDRPWAVTGVMIAVGLVLFGLGAGVEALAGM